MSLERLNDLMKPIDTGLKAVVAVEFGRSGEISAPDLTRNLVENGIVIPARPGQIRKKIESVKAALEGLVKGGYAVKHDTGEKKFQTPSHTYAPLYDNSGEVVDIAKRTIDVCSQLTYPCHDFWDIKGGSFSSDLKHVRQGMQMATFYGIMPEDLVPSVGTDVWDVLEPEILPSVEIRNRLGLTQNQMKTYLTKFVAKGFFNKSGGIKNKSLTQTPDLVNNGYGERRSAGNTRLYSLTDAAQHLVLDLFIPCLAVASGCSNGEIRETNSKFENYETLLDSEKKVVGLHYGSIKNQYNK